MRPGLAGFAAGTLALIALYALVQPNAAKAVTAGGNVFTAALRRVLSPDVAGVPLRKPPAAAQAADQSHPASGPAGPGGSQIYPHGKGF